MNLDFISLIILLSVSFFFVVIAALQKKKFSSANVFALIFSTSIFLIASIQILMKFEMKLFLSFDFYMGTLFLTANSCILALFCLLAIEDLNSKKLKTLWRLPALVFLLAYFDIKFHSYIALAIYLMIGFIFIKNKERLRVFIPSALFLAFLALFFNLFDFQNFWQLNILFLLLLSASQPLWSAGRVRMITFSQGQTL